MWTIEHIFEADFGCEERADDEPLMALVTLVSEDGRTMQLEVADSWLTKQGLDEGDEWPEDVEAMEAESDQAANMADFMANYYSAVEEMDDE